MTTLRIAFAQWPEGLFPGDEKWVAIAKAVAQERPDLLITNEMPFGPWLAESDRYDPIAAASSISLHEVGVEALRKLHLPAVISSRPVRATDRIANEAFALVHGEYQFIHQKHYFPDENGFHETSWFSTEKPGFLAVDINGVTAGILLCTEVMFNEHARHYGHAGVDLIAVPRASGTEHHQWETALSMAAIVSGAYVVSANRTGRAASQLFGGRGMLFSPSGRLIDPEALDPSSLILAQTIDLNIAKHAKSQYPCYVAEFKLNA